MPFFAAELADAIATHPATQRQCEDGLELPLPRRAATTVLHRVFALGADARQVASVVALLGWVGVDRLPMIATVTTMTEQRTEDAFDRLVRARLLIPDGTTYRFTHAIVRDALLADVHPARQRRLHRQIARVLADERRAGERRDIAEIADHLRLGIAGHDPAAAVLLTEAGDAVAVRQPHRRGDVVPRGPRPAAPRPPRRRRDPGPTEPGAEPRRTSCRGRQAGARPPSPSSRPVTARSDALAVAAHAALVTGDRQRATELLEAPPSDGDAPPTPTTVVRALVDAFDASPDRRRPRRPRGRGTRRTRGRSDRAGDARHGADRGGRLRGGRRHRAPAAHVATVAVARRAPAGGLPRLPVVGRRPRPARRAARRRRRRSGEPARRVVPQRRRMGAPADGPLGRRHRRRRAGPARRSIRRSATSCSSPPSPRSPWPISNGPMWLGARRSWRGPIPCPSSRRRRACA